MNHRIGHIAGKVWRLLGEKGSASLSQVETAVDENPELTSMALGWLARENKVTFHETGNARHTTVTVSLTPEERRIFESTRDTASVR
jgi:hypothetical protein